MTEISHLPQPGIILDLDAEPDLDPEDRKPPFVVKVGGKVITFADPSELDWRDLAAVEIPVDLIRVSLSREDRDHISQTPMTSRTFGRLMKAYYDHYGLEDRIRDAKRQAQFNS